MVSLGMIAFYILLRFNSKICSDENFFQISNCICIIQNIKFYLITYNQSKNYLILKNRRFKIGDAWQISLLERIKYEGMKNFILYPFLVAWIRHGKQHRQNNRWLTYYGCKVVLVQVTPCRLCSYNRTSWDAFPRSVAGYQEYGISEIPALLLVNWACLRNKSEAAENDPRESRDSIHPSLARQGLLLALA